MTLYRRRLAVPDGHYAVPDPDRRITYWSVVAGRWSDWPEGSRWRPDRPRADHPLPPDRHRRERQDWYDEVYGPWCEQVADAIEADPAGAAERFRLRHGSVQLPAAPAPPPVRVRPLASRSRPTRADRELRRQVETVAVLRLAGFSYRQIARLLGIPKSTVHRRATEGSAPVHVPHGFARRGTPEKVLGAFLLVDRTERS